MQVIRDKLEACKSRQAEDKKIEAEKAKKKQQPQKGIPDWLQELYDPLENIVNTQRPSQQAGVTQREAGSKSSFSMTLKDLISRPMSRMGGDNQDS